jgi:hypothetical protein
MCEISTELSRIAVLVSAQLRSVCFRAGVEGGARRLSERAGQGDQKGFGRSEGRPGFIGVGAWRSRPGLCTASGKSGRKRLSGTRCFWASERKGAPAFMRAPCSLHRAASPRLLRRSLRSRGLPAPAAVMESLFTAAVDRCSAVAAALPMGAAFLSLPAMTPHQPGIGRRERPPTTHPSRLRAAPRLSTATMKISSQRPGAVCKTLPVVAALECADKLRQIARPQLCPGIHPGTNTNDKDRRQARATTTFTQEQSDKEAATKQRECTQAAPWV